MTRLTIVLTLVLWSCATAQPKKIMYVAEPLQPNVTYELIMARLVEAEVEAKARKMNKPVDIFAAELQEQTTSAYLLRLYRAIEVCARERRECTCADYNACAEDLPYNSPPR